VTLVIAHRGGLGEARENSIEAFEQAIGAGADMVEFDVRRTLDGELIVFHDERCGGIRISEWTSVGVRSICGFSPTTLAEVVQTAGPTVGMDVELKEAGYELEALRHLAQFRRSGLVITSFRSEVVNAVGRIDHGCLRGLSVGARSQSLLAIDDALVATASHLVAHRSLVNRALLLGAQAAGLTLLVWTVNRRSDLVRILAEPLIGGVITDRPERALRIRDPD